MAAGVLHAVKTLSQKYPERYQYLLKLDTDALVIAPFIEKLSKFFNDNEHIGEIGSYLLFPDGEERPGNQEWAPLIMSIGTMRFYFRRRYFIKLLEHIGRVTSSNLAWRRKLWFVRIALLGSLTRHRTWRLILDRATKTGYQPGFHVQGGSYAISGRVLRSPYFQHCIDDCTISYGTNLSEDVLVSLLVIASNFELQDYNRRTQCFGIWWRWPTFDQRELLEREYSIIHSVKHPEGLSAEKEFREFFRALRN